MITFVIRVRWEFLKTFPITYKFLRREFAILFKNQITNWQITFFKNTVSFSAFLRIKKLDNEREVMIQQGGEHDYMTVHGVKEMQVWDEDGEGDDEDDETGNRN